MQGLLGLYRNPGGAGLSRARLRPSGRASGGDGVSEPQSAEETAGRLQLRSVMLDHRRGSEVLSNVSLEAMPGRVTAIVGPSGVGKSTIADLILRRLDPDEGQVLLDGTDVRKLKLSDLRRHIAVVEQETFLWNASIEENIRYGRPEGIHDVERAARLAGIHDFILSLPQGYLTQVGERAPGFGGPETAHRHRPGATAGRGGPDPRRGDLGSRRRNRARSRAGPRAPLRARTTLVLSHRLPLVARADRVLVLDCGRVVQDGTFEALSSQGGVFQRLFGAEVALP